MVRVAVVVNAELVEERLQHPHRAVGAELGGGVAVVAAGEDDLVHPRPE